MLWLQGAWDVYWVESKVMRTGRIYGQAGDGSWLFTFKTEAQAIAETASPRNGETADCVYDGRVKSADGQSSARAQNGWVRWGAAETAEALYGSWAVVVSVGWLCLGCAWCGLRRLERNYECSSSGEKWGVGVICCAEQRSSEREILMQDLGEANATDEEDGGEDGQQVGHVADSRALSGGGLPGGAPMLAGGTR